MVSGEEVESWADHSAHLGAAAVSGSGALITQLRTVDCRERDPQCSPQIILQNRPPNLLYQQISLTLCICYHPMLFVSRSHFLVKGLSSFTGSNQSGRWGWYLKFSSSASYESSVAFLCLCHVILSLSLSFSLSLSLSSFHCSLGNF